jgi:hypothetical protein
MLWDTWLERRLGKARAQHAVESCSGSYKKIAKASGAGASALATS